MTHFFLTEWTLPCLIVVLFRNIKFYLPNLSVNFTRARAGSYAPFLLLTLPPPLSTQPWTRLCTKVMAVVINNLYPGLNFLGFNSACYLLTMTFGNSAS